MATMLDTVTRALRLAGVIAAGETPSAEDAADGVTYLNEMLHGWAKQGVDLTHVTLAAADDLPFHDSYLEGIRYNLAARFIEEWGMPPKPMVIAHASSMFRSFQAHTLEYPDDAEVDRALQPQYFGRRDKTGYNIDEG